MKLHLIMFLAWLVWVVMWLLSEIQSSNRRREQAQRKQG